ncbi:substrate-binding periplasmic protein [Silvanigrella sp.]|uniref:substrate-binding periplasmic protein n=1 Tax=Silvanigrella sp. TaxID=2024976 RepID=UPI0037CC8B7A
MKVLFLSLIFIFQLFTNINSYSVETILTMHVRDRYPEIVIENNKFSGPLIDIINEAANNIGIKIEFIEAPFTRTLIDLENGKVDLCPRFSKSPEREEFTYFLGPISTVNKIVYFIVPKGQEKIIKSYDDLKKYPVAIKRGTYYFEKFNKDNSIQKLEYKDDENMSLMFMNKRFKVIAIRDYLAMKRYFEKNNFKDYTTATYRHEEIVDIFYGMSKKSPHLNKKEILNKALNKMRTDGRVKKIYEKYGIKE